MDMTEGSVWPPGGRCNAGSGCFMAQVPPPKFCWWRCKSARPRGRSGAARRRMRALSPG